MSRPSRCHPSRRVAGCCQAATASLLLPLLLGPPGRHLAAGSQRGKGARLGATLGPPCADGAGSACIEEVTSTIDDGGVWYARLGSEATRAIVNGDPFDAKGNALCEGEPLPVEVTVSPRINTTDPVSGSYAHVEMMIDPRVAAEHETLYVCFKGRLALRPCLAELHAPHMSSALRRLMAFGMLSESVVKRSDLVKQLDEASMHAFAILLVVLILVCVCILLALMHALLALVRFPGNKPIAELPAIKPQKPRTSLAKVGRRMISFVAAVANLIGIGLPLVMKTAPQWLLALIYVWPGTFGVYVVIRISFLKCRVQSYNAGFFHGKIVIACKQNAVHTKLVWASVAWLFACYFAAMSYMQSAANVGAATALVASPVISIVSMFVSLQGFSEGQTKKTIKVRLDDLAHMDLDGLKGGSDTDVRTLLCGQSMVEVSEGALFDVCRSGADPIATLDDSSEGLLTEGRPFGLLDYRWHPGYIYRVTGSRAAFWNLPLLLLLMAILISISMQWFLQCATMLPRLNRLEFGRGSLLVPAFEPERRFYTLYTDAAVLDLQLMHSMETATTNEVSISLSRGAFQSSTASEGLMSISLRDVSAPWEVQIWAKAGWGRALDYTLQLLPVSTVVRSIMFRAGGWARCIDWGDITKQTVVTLPTSSAPLTLDMYLMIDEFILSRPERDDGPPSRTSGQIFTVFEVFNTSAESCSDLCAGRPSCCVAWDGVGGCFFGMQDNSFSSCQPHHNHRSDSFSGALISNRTMLCSVRVCLLGEAGGRSCRIVQSNSLGQVRVENITIPSSDTCNVEVAVLRANQEGRHVTVASAAFTLSRRPPAVRRALAYAQGVHMSVAADTSGIHLAIHDMDVSNIPDPFTMIVIPFVEDDGFIALEVRRDDLRLFESSCEHRGSFELAKDCAANPELRRLTVCGGRTYSRACALSVPKWKPAGTWQITLGNGFSFEEARVDIVVSMDQETAEFAMRKDCAVAFNQPPEDAVSLISPGIFECGVEKCLSGNITLKAFAASTFSRMDFFLLGVAAFPGIAASFFNLAQRARLAVMEHFDQVAEFASTKVGVQIAVPSHSIRRDMRIWTPWRIPGPIRMNFNVEVLASSGYTYAAKYACLHSDVTPRIAYRALIGLFRSPDMGLFSTVAALVSCFRTIGLRLGTPMEHQSPEVHAIRRHHLKLLKLFKHAQSVSGGMWDWVVGASAKRGPVISYITRDVFNYAVAYGCAECIESESHSNTNLTAMRLTERELPGMVRAMRENIGVKNLDLSWNRLGLRGVSQLMDAVKEKKRLRRLRIGHNVEASSKHGKLDRLRYQFLTGLPDLRELDVSGSDIGPTGALEFESLLVSMLHLETLNLSSNNLGDRGVAAMSASLGGLRALRSLDLSGNNISAASLRVLSAAALSELEALYLSENLLGEGNCSVLADFLSHMTSLRHLGLGGNRISAGGAEKIQMALDSMASLQTLDLSQNPITDVGLAALRLDQRSTLTALDLSGTGLGARGSGALSAALPALQRLQVLRLDSNEFGAAGVAALVPGLSAAGQLVSLSLGDNAIGGASGEGAAALTRALHGLTNLRHIDMRENEFRSADLDALCERLRGMRRLETLRIQGNNFSSEAFQIWDCLAGLSWVRSLDLSNNRMFTESEHIRGGKVKAALQGMKRLMTLLLHGNQLSEHDAGNILDFVVDLVDRNATGLKLVQLRGTVPVPGDLITEEDVQYFQSMYLCLLLV